MLRLGGFGMEGVNDVFGPILIMDPFTFSCFLSLSPVWYIKPLGVLVTPTPAAPVVFSRFGVAFLPVVTGFVILVCVAMGFTGPATLEIVAGFLVMGTLILSPIPQLLQPQ